MHRAGPLLMRAVAPRLIHAAAPRQSLTVLVGVGVTGAAFLGLRSALMRVQKPALYNGAHNASTVAGEGDAQPAAAAADDGNSEPSKHVPHPGMYDSTTARLTKNMYTGGFDVPEGNEKMSRREAALILGCRETASRDRIMERYRALMKINHPDRGGSPFLSLKVNEAKDVLFKTAREDKKKEH